MRHEPPARRSLTLIGQTLAHDRITTALGADGMGEVYRATDTKLRRDVASRIVDATVETAGQAGYGRRRNHSQGAGGISMRGALGLVMCTAVVVTSVSAQGSSIEDRQEALERYRSGVRLMGEEKFESAVPELRAATRLAPAFVHAHYELGRALLALDRHPEAVRALATCRDVILSLNEPDLMAADRLAQGALYGNPYAHLLSSAPVGELIALRARQNLQGLSDRSGDRKARVPAEIYLALGSAHYHQGHMLEAETAYRSALAEDHDFGPAHNNLAAICLQTGRLDEARREIQAAEAAGFVVNGRLKRDLELRTKTAHEAERN